MVPTDVISPQPNPSMSSMQDDVRHANERRPQIVILRAGLALGPHLTEVEYCPLAPFY
jgi:hypothetical protein